MNPNQLYVIITVILLLSAAAIGYLLYRLNSMKSYYQYKSNKLDHVEDHYQTEIDKLNTTIASLNETAFTHSVTKIGNIEYFMERFNSLLDRYPQSDFIIVGFSISNMGKINQFFGPTEGDQVMIYTANILKEKVLNTTTYAHVNSNLFALLFRDTSENAILDTIAMITEQLKNYNPEFSVTANFGLYQLDRQNTHDSFMDIMNRTLLAQKSIPDPVSCNYAYFTEDMSQKYEENQKMSQEMEQALNEHKFMVFLQPMVDLHSYKIISAEALVRWDYPGRGILSPYAFLPLFESTSLMQKLDYYMWEECCKVLRRWIDNKMNPIPITMNISPIHLQSPSFIEKLDELTKAYLISKDYLILELPERGISNGSKEITDIVTALKEHDYTLCIDNFGSVHSPLNLLNDMPISRIKLDRAFLARNSGNDRGLTILRYLIAMAKELDLMVITEGVETLEQANFLADIGCDVGQGYLFSKPVDLRSFDKLSRSMLKALYRPSEYYPTFDDFEKDVDIITQMMQRLE